jgi:hypothetical protein
MAWRAKKFRTMTLMGCQLFNDLCVIANFFNGTQVKASRIFFGRWPWLEEHHIDFGTPGDRDGRRLQALLCLHPSAEKGGPWQLTTVYARRTKRHQTDVSMFLLAKWRRDPGIFLGMSPFFQGSFHIEIEDLSTLGTHHKGSPPFLRCKSSIG